MKNNSKISNFQFINRQVIMGSLLFLILISCKKNLEKTETIRSIDLEDALNNYENSSRVELLSDLKYIKLETDKSCIVGDYPRFFCDDDFIIANSFERILLFNKKTGTFYKEIGEYDKGPNGYRYTITTLAYNEEDKIIYAGDWNNNYCGYNYNNKKAIHIYPPHKYIGSIGYINDSLYAGFIYGNIGGKEIKMSVFNKNGNEIKIFPNYLSYDESKYFLLNLWEGIFYRASGKLYFKEIYNDTLFQVNANALIPRYIFKMGKYSPPAEKRDELEKIITRDQLGNVTWLLDNYIKTKVICESVRYIFFEFNYQTLDYWGCYDKRTGETNVQKNAGNILMNGIEMPFRLTRAFVNQKNQELITFIDAYELVMWIENNPEKVKALPQGIQQQFKQVKESDNPIVIIAKVKE